MSLADGGRSTWLHGKPRRTKSLSCGMNLVNSVRQKEQSSAYLVLVVEGLEAYVVAKVATHLFLERKRTTNLCTEG